MVWFHNMSSIDLATPFKNRMYLLKEKSITDAFPRSTDIIQVLNELPSDKRHIKVPQACTASQKPCETTNKMFNVFCSVYCIY